MKYGSSVGCGAGHPTEHKVNSNARSGSLCIAERIVSERGGIRLYVYCLYCQTNRCDRIASLLELRGAKKAFSPKNVCSFRKEGKLVDKAYPMLPGYVFFYMDQPIENSSIVFGINGVIRWLGDRETGRQLIGEDYDFAVDLFERNGRLDSLTLIQEGERIWPKDPLFSGHHGKVVKVDRRKRRAKIQFTFDGQEREVWLGCDILERDGGFA